MLSLTSIDSMASSSMATSMTSGMSRSYPQSPDGIPPIDPMAIHEVENQARLVADSLDLMMGNLRNSLHQVTMKSDTFLSVLLYLYSLSPSNLSY